jgi:hypothetical protein
MPQHLLTQVAAVYLVVYFGLEPCTLLPGLFVFD